MRNVFVIARKELLSTFRQRNLIFIMFLSPIVLVAIMALAFSGLGASGGPDFADISVAVVNQDEGFTLQEQFPASVTNPSLADVNITLGGQEINLGEQLEQNLNVDLSAGEFDMGGFSLNFGNQLAATLLSQPVTASTILSGMGDGFDLDALTCPLLPADEQGEDAFDGSLDDLLDAVAVSDPAAARAGVANGDYAVAVIIPPDFSNQLAPDLGLGESQTITTTGVVTTGLVEVVANNATPISASIVRSIVEGIVIQFERVTMAMSTLLQMTIDRLAQAELDSSALAEVDPSLLNVDVLTRTLQSVDASVLEPLGCLILPGANTIEMEQQPLDIVQTRNPFTFLMVFLGAGQAIFFALFTGVFGINSIYEDRRQGTLQRVLAAPVTSGDVLYGRVLGNMLIVTSQLVILFTAFTLIASVVEGELTFIWGTNVFLLLLVIVGLALFATGMGVLIVGLANSSEQVQLIGPMVTLLIGAVGGIFGTIIPPEYARFSPTWWGIEAIRKLSVEETDIGLHLLILFGAGALMAVAGTFFFRRRMGL
jgi:ABC-2 type transport system permease protein